MLGGAEHPEEPDDAEIETGSFSISMLGMVEVESFGHGSEDSDVGWRAAVLRDSIIRLIMHYLSD